MTRIAKLYATLMVPGNASLRFRDFERLLTAFGFVKTRQSGSHRVYTNAQCHRPMIVQPRGDEAKAYQVREFLDMVEEYRLSMDD